MLKVIREITGICMFLFAGGLGEYNWDHMTPGHHESIALWVLYGALVFLGRLIFG